MNITIVENSLPTLAPLGTVKPAAELKLCGMTWRRLVRHRWIDGLGKSTELTLTAELNFWPSAALLESIKEHPAGFKVITADGNVVASGTHAPVLNALGLAVNPVEGISAPNTDTAIAEIPVDSDSRIIRYPWELLSLQEEFMSDAPHGIINGTINEGSVIDGNLDLGDGSMILPGVFITGNVVIGRDCHIGPNCCLRGPTAIGDGCRIGQGAEIKNSIIMDNVNISHISYIGDSIIANGCDIGAGTMIANFRHDGGSIASKVGGKLVDTGRTHFGAIIGENVHTGVNTSVYPGRKIGAGVTTRPGDIVRKDI